MSSSVRMRIKRANLLKQLRAGISSDSENAAEKYAKAVSKEARIIAPVDTGRLKKSIRAKKILPTRWEVRVTAPYAVYVEYGTRHMAAQPYLRPALRIARKSLRRNMKKIVTP